MRKMKIRRAAIGIGLLGVVAAIGCCLWFWDSIPGGKEHVVTVTPKEQGTITQELSSGIAPEDINSLESILNVQATYKAGQDSLDGRIHLTADALVTVPDVEVIPIQRVNEKEFSQEWIDTVTSVFFGDSPVYLASAYGQRTKEELDQAIAKLESYVQEGIMDPYNYGYAEDGSYNQDAFQMIDALVEEKQIAPETRKKIPVKPGFDLGSEGDSAAGAPEAEETTLEEETRLKLAEEGVAAWGYETKGFVDETGDETEFPFVGVVEMPDGGKYQYYLDRYSGHMDININRIYDSQDPVYPQAGDYWVSTRSQAVESKGANVDGTPVVDASRREEYAGISMDQAQQIAEEKVSALGLTDMRVGSWEFQVQYSNLSTEYGHENSQTIQKGGWLFHFVRQVNSVPVTYTNEMGGAMTDVINENEEYPWGYERVDILVSKDGIEEAVISNLYELGEVINENPALLDYNQIIEIFEKNYFAGDHQGVTEQILHLTDVKLGYSRLYDPNYPDTGELVPVWDFFGWEEGAQQWETDAYYYVNDSPYNSYMTINAITGAVIDRGLGY